MAIVERVRLVWSERKEAFSSPEDSWALFLLIWMMVPVLFFSASQSKLPGYILPAVPAGALLVAEYLAPVAVEEKRFSLLVRRRSRGCLRSCWFLPRSRPASITLNSPPDAAEAGSTSRLSLPFVFALGIAVALLSRRGAAPAASAYHDRGRGGRLRRSFDSPRRRLTPRNPRVPLPRAFSLFRTNRCRSRSITSTACRNTVLSSISIVQPRNTRTAKFRPTAHVSGCRARYANASCPTRSRTPSIILNQRPGAEAGSVLGGGSRISF